MMSQPWPPAAGPHGQNPQDPSTPWGPPQAGTGSWGAPPGQSGAWGPPPGPNPQAAYGQAQTYDQGQAYAGGPAQGQAPMGGQGQVSQPRAYAQQGYGQAQAYGQPYGQAVGVPQGYGYPQGQAGGLRCRLCGFGPAAETTFRGHHGMIIVMRFLHLSGPFCRDCGLATFRRMTAETLIAGWWGYASFVITPITVLINLTRRGKVAQLPPPTPPAGVPHGRPLDPGAPLLARPHALIGLAVPVVVALLIIFAALNGS